MPVFVDRSVMQFLLFGFSLFVMLIQNSDYCPLLLVCGEEGYPTAM